MKKVIRFNTDEARILDKNTQRYIDRRHAVNYMVDIDKKTLEEWAKNNGYIKE